MSDEIDQIAEEVNTLFFECTLDELQDMARNLSIDHMGYNRRSLRKTITRSYEEMMDDEQRDREEVKKNLQAMLADVKDIMRRKRKEEERRVEEQQKKSQVNEEENYGDPSERKKGGKSQPEFLKDMYQNIGLFRKELKIRGQIGDPRAKDKLSYISLVHQINEADALGYTEHEIISAIIRAMIPGLPLRSILETKADISLAQLHKFLEAHYDEKNASELVNKLTSLVQLPEESAYMFIIRCIETRQKLLLASSRADITYDKTFIQQLFLRTIENGLSSRFLLHEVKPLLKAGSSDEALIAEISKLSSAEKERCGILGQARIEPE